MPALRKLLLLTLVSGAVGCSGAEIAQLETVGAARQAERQRLIEHAEHHGEAKAKLDRAKNDLKPITLWRSDGDPGARMSTFAGRLGGARASYVRDGSDWTITLTGTGGGPAAMAALGRLAAPGLVVTRIDAAGPAWTANLRTRNVEDAGPASLTPAAAARPTVPPDGVFPSAQRSKLHAEIAMLDREIAELQKIVGEVALFDALQAKIDGELAALEKDPVRLARVLRATGPLFSGPTPLLASGTVDVTAAGYTARGVAASGVTGATFASRKPEGWELLKLEGSSIEVSFPTAQP